MFSNNKLRKCSMIIERFDKGVSKDVCYDCILTDKQVRFYKKSVRKYITIKVGDSTINVFLKQIKVINDKTVDNQLCLFEGPLFVYLGSALWAVFNQVL